MATVSVLGTAQATTMLNQSVASVSINGSGHIIFTRLNGSQFDGGDFTAIVTGIFNTTVNAAVATAVTDAVYNAVSGTKFDKGNVTGAVEFDAGTAPVNNVNIANALITMTLTGNVTIDVANAFPSGTIKPGTQFAVRFTQDATGGRTLTLTGIKKSLGSLVLTTAPNAIDIVTFFWDGATWYAGFMGVDLK